MKDKSAHMSRLKTLREDAVALTLALGNGPAKSKWIKHVQNIDELMEVLEEVPGESR